MNTRSCPLELLELMGDDPLIIGHQHGETYRQKIGEIADIRMEMMCADFPHRRVRDVLHLAEQYLPFLQEFDVDLFLELRGIAEASNVSLERLVVLNNYTDMRDISLADQGQNSDGGCSIIYSPRAASGPVLAQTWDIHASAQPYVIMIRRNDSLIFSITGCLGMTGINGNGLAIAINNLVSLDARVGVIWPALIRKALYNEDALAARDEILNAGIGSGRHFAIADQDHFFGIEASGTKKKVVWDRADQIYFHTNHCLDDEMRKTHVLRKNSTSEWRYQQLDQVIRHLDLSSADKIFVALREVSIVPEDGHPHRTATSGTFVMDIDKRMVVGCEGIPQEELLQWPQTKVSI